jgi:hypothetical protein
VSSSIGVGIYYCRVTSSNGAVEGKVKLEKIFWSREVSEEIREANFSNGHRHAKGVTRRACSSEQLVKISEEIF